MFFTPPVVGSKADIGLVSLDYVLGYGEKEKVLSILPKWQNQK